MPETSSFTMLGRLYDTLPQFLRPVEFRTVRTVGELRASAHLVYDEYLKRNYLKPHASAMKLSMYHTLPSTATFIAHHRQHGIVGTISLVQDSPLGLPMDEAYKNELDELRRQGQRLAEASMLALDSRLFGRQVFTLFHSKKLLLTLRLFKVMFDYLRSTTSVDELVACFNPKHQILYEFLQLKPLGGLKTYSGANGNPSVARHLNVAETERHAISHVAYRLFYGSRPSAKPFANQLRLSPEELRALFVQESSILSAASPSELAYLQSCYPTYAFGKILGPAVPSTIPHGQF